LLKPLRSKLKTLENRIDKLSLEQEQVQAKLADNDIYDNANKEKLKDLLAQQAMVSQSLTQAEEDWLVMSEEMEVLQQGG